MRIEFAGYDVSSGNGQELNSLSMYAVGRGTTLEYVQALAGLDDSFEWWGGAVDGRYLVSYESGDDHFDWTEGYRGRNQFLIAYQSTRLSPRTGAGTLSADPRAFEGDGCDPAVAGCSLSATGASEPFSLPVFANFTVIGPNGLAGFPANGNALVARRGTGGVFVNGAIAPAGPDAPSTYAMRSPIHCAFATVCMSGMSSWPRTVRATTRTGRTSGRRQSLRPTA